MFENLQVKMKEYMSKLPSHKTSIAEAEDLASEFLIIQDLVSDAILTLELDSQEAKSISKMLYANAIQTSTAKNATEKEAQAKADNEFNTMDKLHNNLESKIKYLKIKLGIFNDAHICCRNITKGDK